MRRRLREIDAPMMCTCGHEVEDHALGEGRCRCCECTEFKAVRARREVNDGP